MPAPLTRRTLVSAALVLSATGCFGSFALTNKIYDVNQDVSRDKFVRWLVFLGFIIIPIYELGALLDILLFNSIEFWSGERPLSDAREVRLDEATVVRLRAEGEEGLVLELARAGEAPRVRRFTPQPDGWRVQDGTGAAVAQLREGPLGALEVEDGWGRVVARWEAQDVERALALYRRSGARALAGALAAARAPSANGPQRG